MKIQCRKSESGSVLVTALIMSAVIAIVLGSYLTLVSSRNLITQHSQAWNSAIPVLEAGIEEGFQHLHDDPGSGLTNNGWTYTNIGGQFVYAKQRNFTDGSYNFVTLYNATSISPIIYSQGFVPTPLTANQYISRTVRVMTTNSTMFTKAVASKGPVKIGGQASVDSFNSTDPLYSTNGMYDPTKRKANGAVVTDSRAQPAMTLGSGHVNGKIDTGPGGTVTIGGSGTVGDLNWSSGIQPGYTGQDMNETFPDQSAPAGAAGWTAPAGGNYSIGGTNYRYSLSGNYTVNGGFGMNSGQSMIVTAPSTLYVTGSFSMNNASAYIYIAPGASLTLIVGGPNASMGGGGVVNGGGLAANFSYIGLPSNTTVKYSGNAQFVGTVNAPEADFTLSGGSDMIGAAIVNSFTSVGGSSVHYDEALAAPGILVMTSYTEL